MEMRVTLIIIPVNAFSGGKKSGKKARQSNPKAENACVIKPRMILVGSGTSRASKAAAETMKKKLRTMFIAQGG